MTWIVWLLVAWSVLEIVAEVSGVGREREPITPGMATWSVLIVLVQIALILLLGGIL